VRVLVTGAAGALGHRVTTVLEEEKSVDAIAAIDLRPPPRRFRRAELTVIDPRERRKLVIAVRRFAPTAIVHLGIYEPDARSTPAVAAERTQTATLAVLGAAADLGGLDRIVVRSGLEVYGRGPGMVSVPDEDVAPDPRTAFGRSLVDVERVAAATGQSADVPVAALRLAPVQGPGVPSPLARLLRLPAVPVDALADPTFSLVHVDDAAAAVVVALRARHHGPLNVVGPGAVSVLQAVRLGGRVPVPVLGPGWALARVAVSAAGAPLPDHHLELIRRGRTADGGRARAALGIAPRPTLEVMQGLHAWVESPALRLIPGSSLSRGGAARLLDR
jgi:UDP-glucose 4-epimerase